MLKFLKPTESPGHSALVRTESVEEELDERLKHPPAEISITEGRRHLDQSPGLEKHRALIGNLSTKT